MRIIDAHCHAAPDWYEPVEALLFQMDRQLIFGSVAARLFYLDKS